MKKMHFSIHIPADQYLAYYQGSAKFVKVMSEEGLSLRFPAAELQKFVTHEGIKGRFQIVFNAQHKLVSLNRL